MRTEAGTDLLNRARAGLFGDYLVDSRDALAELDAAILTIERQAVKPFEHEFLGGADTSCFNECGLPLEHPIHVKEE